MSFAVIVGLALLVVIGYFLVLLVGETISWLFSRITRSVEERRYVSDKSPTTSIRST